MKTNDLLLYAGIGLGLWWLLRRQGAGISGHTPMARVPSSRGGYLYDYQGPGVPATRGNYLLSGIPRQEMTQIPPFDANDLLTRFTAGVAGVGRLPYYGSSSFGVPSRFGPYKFNWRTNIAPTPWNGYDLEPRNKYYVYQKGIVE
jgi:hypothetical protein